jgi:hypothetical protein
LREPRIAAAIQQAQLECGFERVEPSRYGRHRNAPRLCSSTERAGLRHRKKPTKIIADHARNLWGFAFPAKLFCTLRD